MRAQDEALKRGVTGVESLEQASSYAALQRARGRGDLKVRALMGIPHRSLALSLPTTGTPPQIRDTAPFDFDAALRGGCAPVRRRVAAARHVKFFTDGALGSQTAALETRTRAPRIAGSLTFDPMELRTDVARAAAGGLAVAIHAIGDRAVRVALDAIAPTRITSPALRQRLEHIQLVREEDLGRFGALGISRRCSRSIARAIAISPIATGDRSARRALIRGGPFSIEAPFSRSVRTPRSNPSIPCSASTPRSPAAAGRS